MKFYKMKNGDFVTDLHVSTIRAHALKCMRIFNAKTGQYCFEPRTYCDGVARSLNTDECVVMTKSLNKAMTTKLGAKPPKKRERFAEGKKALTAALTKVKESIHERTA